MGDHHHDHDHAHGHDHDHAPIEEVAAAPVEDRILETAIRELLIEKGVISAEDVHRQIDIVDSRNPALGARVVARAWTDPDFKARLIEHPLKTIQDTFGMDMTSPLELVVLENTPEVHNVVVCTLCSCYPRMLLGIPPAWYKAVDYRSRVVREPRAVLAEFGVTLPDAQEVRVSDSTADLRFLVLPARPEGTEGWSEEALAAIVTRDCMIGTGLPDPAVKRDEAA
ncbi:MAG: nitrile hydratase subunit alpha [Alphaproteobacteria bacterium]|nr:nitrile hydratase subunit alpha [Alphaproteobacteria bacterium]MDX5368072.1 nitrile hydratase subunit alpha [Alphaproteobacteria bacterium]MDX5462911.1 nitrile hydratase subunit alpha [Alphaproteobacteria bacterium]